MKEAEFAFKQALAFCPYSPEAVFRYINLLLANLHENPARIDDALLIAETCRKLDPGNAQVADLVNRLREIRKANENLLRVSELEKNFLVNPTVSNAFSLAQVYLLANDTNKAVNALATSLMQPSLNTNELAALATAFMQLNQVPLLEQTLVRMSKVASNTAEVFYDLAGVQALQGKNNEALTNLQRAMELNQQARAANPNTKNFREEILGDGRFHILRSHPDFLKIISGK
jgi:tetratricopeptide (TPR) repeat protein